MITNTMPWNYLMEFRRAFGGSHLSIFDCIALRNCDGLANMFGGQKTPSRQIYCNTTTAMVVVIVALVVVVIVVIVVVVIIIAK